MALNTGRKITRRSWDVISILDIVIDRVNTLGTGQPEMLTYTDRHGRLIRDIEIPGVDPEDDRDNQCKSAFPADQFLRCSHDRLQCLESGSHPNSYE